MKVIIQENERGILFKDGIYQRILEPGKHRVSRYRGQTVMQVDADGQLDMSELTLSVLAQDPVFTQSTTVIDVPDTMLAFHFVDGHICDVLTGGRYVYWTVISEHTFEIVDISQPESASQYPTAWMGCVPVVYASIVNVSDGEIGLLFYDGVFQKTLSPGKYHFWTSVQKVLVQLVNTRVQQLEILGQEILTADKVSLRMNFVCTYQVTDPVKIVTKLKDYRSQLHIQVQLILREFAGRYRFDELLRQKDSIGGFVLEKLQERQPEFFVSFTDAGVKDIILPGEIRDIMNTVLIAEKAAQASVITRREETAATKSLLETARLMDENATLYRLKELEYIERICERIGSISIDGGGGGGILKNLGDLLSSKST